MVVSPCFWRNTNNKIIIYKNIINNNMNINNLFPNGLLNDFRLPRRPLMVRAALLRRRCADELVRLIMRVASATELMLLRRS